jgi:ubiquinol-cytochrome c reductase cytochrome c1 subunit
MRLILGFIGTVFAAVLLISLFSNLATYFSNPPAPLASDVFHKEPKALTLRSDGPFGKFDKAQVQRGLQVYTEVCKGCHSLKLVSFRDLKGLGYNDAEIKAYAKQWDVPSINPDTGEPATRKGLPSDTFPPPFANETAARANNNNALPPDLSLITKAREGGAAYVFSILTGYQNQPAELLRKFPDTKTPPNLHYNPYFANLNIAMPPPLKGGEITFADGTPNTLQQEAKDVAAFLAWTAEPNLENRHAAGLAVTAFLLVASILAFLAYKQIWHDEKHPSRVPTPIGPKRRATAPRRTKAKG